eukprot:CAMPEP_0169463008 /NCGR_PEP_ID=MMETSP1042-20121227/19869_1 /TAXON_ID=464988 /ORGANISM="Hemiselmis andersenii, Strain CCMP1180" /LENGTH=113 /DNA_ID=CAMNT_0009575693 /DNA_START=162 /DNA_END=500 /DNA_ORIENTATION=+
MIVDCCHISTPLEQLLCALCMPTESSRVESRLATVVLRLNICSARKQLPYTLKAGSDCGDAKCRPTNVVPRIYENPPRKELPHDRNVSIPYSLVQRRPTAFALGLDTRPTFQQ